VLIAAWVLAAATAVLAVSGPVALFVWLGARRSDRERRARDHERELEERILAKTKTELDAARGTLVPKEWIGSTAAVSAIAGLVALAVWNDRKNSR
jgi:hypothetical protein